jgi:hypothetical protein
LTLTVNEKLLEATLKWNVPNVLNDALDGYAVFTKINNDDEQYYVGKTSLKLQNFTKVNKIKFLKRHQVMIIILNC